MQNEYMHFSPQQPYQQHQLQLNWKQQQQHQQNCHWAAATTTTHSNFPLLPRVPIYRTVPLVRPRPPTDADEPNSPKATRTNRANDDVVTPPDAQRRDRRSRSGSHRERPSPSSEGKGAGGGAQPPSELTDRGSSTSSVLDSIDAAQLTVPFNVCEQAHRGTWRGLSRGVVEAVVAVFASELRAATVSLSSSPSPTASSSGTTSATVAAIRDSPFLKRMVGEFLVDIVSRMRRSNSISNNCSAVADPPASAGCDCWRREQLLTYWLLIDAVLKFLGACAVGGDGNEACGSSNHRELARHAIGRFRAALGKEDIVRDLLLQPLLSQPQPTTTPHAVAEPSGCSERLLSIHEKATRMVRSWERLVPQVFQLCATSQSTQRQAPLSHSSST